MKETDKELPTTPHIVHCRQSAPACHRKEAEARQAGFRRSAQLGFSFVPGQVGAFIQATNHNAKMIVHKFSYTYKIIWQL